LTRARYVVKLGRHRDRLAKLFALKGVPPAMAADDDDEANGAAEEKAEKAADGLFDGSSFAVALAANGAQADILGPFGPAPAEAASETESMEVDTI
jgi:hypothetical protein